MSGFRLVCAWTVFVSAIWLPSSVAFRYRHCPGPIAVNTLVDTKTAKVTWTHPILEDVGDMGSVSQTVSHNPGEQFPIGLTRVNYLAINTTDYRDLKVCSFVITVKDPFPPIFHTCPTNITVQLETNQTHSVVNWDAPVATDNSQYVQILATHKPGDDYMAGSVTVTYTARDMAGNSDHCVFHVIVLEWTTTAAPTTATTTTTQEVTTGKSSTSKTSGHSLHHMSHVDWKVWTTRGLIWVSVLCVMTLAIIGVFACRKYHLIRRLKKSHADDDREEIYPSSPGEEYDMWEDPQDISAFQVSRGGGDRREGRKQNKAEVLPLLFAPSDMSRDQ